MLLKYVLTDHALNNSLQDPVRKFNARALYNDIKLSLKHTSSEVNDTASLTSTIADQPRLVASYQRLMDKNELFRYHS